RSIARPGMFSTAHPRWPHLQVLLGAAHGHAVMPRIGCVVLPGVVFAFWQGCQQLDAASVVICHDGRVNSPSSVHVRPARVEDQAVLAALDAAAWSPQSAFPSVIQSGSGPELAFFSSENPPEIHLVAEMDDILVGYIRLKPPTHLPENAHALRAAAGHHALARGGRKLSLRVLSTNQPAIGLYERLGFEREGVLRSEFHINGTYVDDVLMAMSLQGGA